MSGDPTPTIKQQKAVDENWTAIRKDLKKVVKWLKYQKLPE
jgi:hypothetical protein